MNIDLASTPTTLDMLHLGLAVFTLFFFVLFLIKGKGTGKPTHHATANTSNDNQPASEPTAKPLKTTTPDAALQLLTLLQQDARFIDFIHEDLSAYSDADIGAAARIVHEGSQKTLSTYFNLEAIRSEDEETQITLPEGFNASEVRLTGQVTGTAPFTGTLIHKGWKVKESKLPKIADGHDTSVIAPAEVEL